MKLTSVALLLAITVACHTVRSIPGPDLSRTSFRVVKARAMSVQSGFKLFGFIPFSTPSRAEAEVDIYASSGVNPEGRSLMLVNQIEERSAAYFLLFSIPKLTFTADIVELTGKKD